jgi:hypothetical protein
MDTASQLVLRYPRALRGGADLGVIVRTFGWLWLGLVGCVAPDPVDDDPPPVDDTVPVVDTDPAPADPDPPRVVRPLCAAEAAPSVVAPDVAAWATALRAGSNRFFGTLQSDPFEAMGETGLGQTARAEVENRLERGFHRLRLGRVDDALVDLQAALALAEAEVPQWRGRAREVLAVAWIRRAELDNCVANAGGEACLVPFTEDGVHALEEGMTQAAALLHDFLREDDPDKLGPRWLYNVAHMALGTYPEGVDPRFVVPDTALRSEHPAPAWANLGPSLGLTEPTISGGAALEDFDGDGLLDVLTSSMDPAVGMSLKLNNGDGTLCDATPASGLAAMVGHLNFSVADYDNDGDMDVFAPRGAWYELDGAIRPSLLQNDGTGRFTDVAVQAGLTDVVGGSQVGVWADYDNDGWLDLFVGRERASERPDDYVPSSLYRARGDGSFESIGPALNLDVQGWVKGAAWGDFDNDGDPDLYISMFGSDNLLYRNTVDEVNKFILVNDRQPIEAPRSGFSAFFFDYDQDGFLDIFAAAYPNPYAADGVLSDTYGQTADPYISGVLGVDHPAETARLYRNATPFDDVTKDLELDDWHATMGSGFGDFDVDGFPDLYLGTGAPAYDALEPNVAYRNDAGQAFQDVSSDMHVGHLQKGHGVSFGDIDEDGDEDLLAEVGGAFPADAFPNPLFFNPTETGGRVILRLVGVTVNRSAVGARVRVVTPLRTFHHVVGGNSSFGNNSLQVEAGLGEATEIAWVEVDWPGGGTEVIEGVTLGSVVTIRQGEGLVESRPFRPVPFDGTAAAGHDMEP